MIRKLGYSQVHQATEFGLYTVDERAIESSERGMTLIKAIITDPFFPSLLYLAISASRNHDFTNYYLFVKFILEHEYLQLPSKQPIVTIVKKKKKKSPFK